jgi:hypothetical protein
MSSLDRLTTTECGQVSKIAAKQQYPKAARAYKDTGKRVSRQYNGMKS